MVEQQSFTGMLITYFVNIYATFKVYMLPRVMIGKGPQKCKPTFVNAAKFLIGTASTFGYGLPEAMYGLE